MSVTDDDFFTENIVNVNKRVEQVLFSASVVPVLFIILSIIGVWWVPHLYSIGIIAYTLITGTICHILNKYPKTQKIDMYTGIIFASIFVFLLGYKGVIVITVAYSFAPFISCLYYDRQLTRVTIISNFISVLLAYWIRSYSVTIVTIGAKEPLVWFIENATGIVIEFVFVYFIADSIARRTNRTLKRLMSSVDERNKAYEDLKKSNQDLAQTQYKIIQFVAQVLGSHDLFTGRHVIHTQKYVEILCKQLRDSGHYVSELTDKNIQLFQTAAFLHDIGKIHIPEGILNKIGKFTPEEFEMMKSHPNEGKKLLEFLPQIDDGDFNEIAKEMAYCHHEKWDGSGYPNGLAGKDIPLSARIMAAADVLDALISQRLYKDPMSVEEAMEVFKNTKGVHFEPCIADAVIACRPIITIVDQDFKTNEASTNAEELGWWQRYHENLK